ncbi:MAG: glucose 1-dehydrogenase, partial [Ktedonobacteraceae bacterium]|nr:glucose 1-dehydrogenase [Ktedonobacteraceae bacterium]
MQEKLQEQVAIVTGGGRGIGKGIALTLAQAGATVVLAEINPETGKEVEEEIRQAGGSALFLQTDVTSETAIRRMVECTVKHYNRIDILVNNAGATVFKPLLDATGADWDDVINLNLRGYFLCSKYVAPIMIERRKGAIIHISSDHAFASIPHAEMYAASKGGINAMTHAMALSLGPYGIRVNAICPGFVATEYFFQQAAYEDAELTRKRDSLHALDRIVRPADIGQLALYLAS